MQKYLYYIAFFLFISLNVSYAQNDSLSYFYNSIKNKNSSNQDLHKELLDSAFDYSTTVKNDSIVRELLYEISSESSKINDSILFRKSTDLLLKLSYETNDSTKIARSYWRYAIFLTNKKETDSSYYYHYRALNMYDALGDKYRSARQLLSMAVLQTDNKDYIGSEVITTQAISLFKEIDNYYYLFRCYNNLGIIYNNLEQYEKAIEHHNEALSYLKKTNENYILEVQSLNNIGVVYKNQGNYKKAYENYNLALEYDSLFYDNTRLYATVLDNLAYSKFKLNDSVGLSKLFFKALQIRDSLKIFNSVAVNKLHLAEYYLSKKDTANSLKFAKEANVTAKSVNAYKELLDSYLLLADVDSKNAARYLKDHIQVTNDLVKHERTIRNKFAKIRFDTDEIISRNTQLTNQNTLIVIVFSIIVLFGFGVYIITQQRIRNKKLEFEQEQQKANAEIYNLMINQQNKIEEGREKEKKRISEELHDGILGRLFGTRLSLGSLNNKDDDSAKLSRLQYINELQSIEEEVRNISHELGESQFNSQTSYMTMVANLLATQSKITNFNFLVEDDDTIAWRSIPGHIKINLYRIIQESIQNINKYANASHVRVDFKRKDNDSISLQIEDNGIGFEETKKMGGIGLKNMRSRVSQLHGEFKIKTKIGSGTAITVNVPITP